MENAKIYLGENELRDESKDIGLKEVMIQNESFFKIENYDHMLPFFMTIVSAYDFWLFVSSTGGVTMGRKDADNALFPYYTDDKIHESNNTTGAHSIFLVQKGKKRYLWEPFNSNVDVYAVTRNLYKNVLGNKIIFEEVNHDLGVTYSYSWQTSNQYGFIKKSQLVNHSGEIREIRLIDGLRNILPYGVTKDIQTTKSTLVDGYKRSELKTDDGLGLYSLSSIISDRAEPSESLRTTSVWSVGLDVQHYLLSEKQLKHFKYGLDVLTEKDIKGVRCAYFITSQLSLEPDENRTWYIVSDLNQTHNDIVRLMALFKSNDEIVSSLNESIKTGDHHLKDLAFRADGSQLTKDHKMSYRHFSNALYNIMRGGIYADDYTIDIQDLKQFIYRWNSKVFTQYKSTLDSFNDVENYMDLLIKIDELNDCQLSRLVYEYLPLTYSRRHGDPSRPWNKFNIEVLNKNGEKQLNYEGNWRDIFQNWEALSTAYPNYIEGIITKFVNASTGDGYNPYRITKEGIDWEVLDPEDPWSNIGYWGDHQIIYLLKLLELSKGYDKKTLSSMLYKENYVYANVPYRIKGLEDILADPRQTIVYDDVCEKIVNKRRDEIGADGKLVCVNEKIYQVTLIEKILVTVLTKLTNFVPEGGIWMNTQRPEWNDANNALVGNGVSMVTLYYLYRFQLFLRDELKTLEKEPLVSVEVVTLFNEVNKILTNYHVDSDSSRYDVVINLGQVGEVYRNKVYKGFSGEKISLSLDALCSFTENTLKVLKQTIHKNKRKDGLYHAYNLLRFENNHCSVTSLYEMLEGQVAVLSSNALDLDETLELLEALKESDLYRVDQKSYMLYPNRSLPTFLDKNNLSRDLVTTSKVLALELTKTTSSIIEKDMNEQYHFNADFKNADDLAIALQKIGTYTDDEINEVKALYIELFDHYSFTGRSGTFFKYEGLGCIYWHMVSKLLLAVQESYQRFEVENNDVKKMNQLAAHYYEIKEGIGMYKSPEVYGAFPTDAYSHTPMFAGVQQPGMTGQVKEDILSRLGELGIVVKDGAIHFKPSLLRVEEFLEEKTLWDLPDYQIELMPQQLGFTFCSIPIIYELSNERVVTVQYKNGDKYKFENTSSLNKEISKKIFNRDFSIEQIIVKLEKHKF